MKNDKNQDSIIIDKEFDDEDGVGKIEQTYDPVNDPPEEKDNRQEIIDEDSDNPPAGTPGHPGLDEDTV